MAASVARSVGGRSSIRAIIFKANFAPSLCSGVPACRSFSTDNSYTGQQIRIERLWRELYFGSGHWRVKEQPDEVMWIEDGGTNAVKKGKELPLPGWQQLTQNPGQAHTFGINIHHARISMY